MPRIEIPITVQDTAGNAIPGASVTVKLRASGAAAVVYLTETTPTPEATNVVTTDSAGRTNGWVDTGAAYVGTVSGSGIATYDEAFDAPSPIPGPVTKPNGFSRGGPISIPANNTTDPNVTPGFFIDPATDGERVFLWRVRYKIHAGTSLTFKIQRNGVDVPGWTGLTAGTGGAVNSLAAVIECFAGDYIQLVPTAGVGSPTGVAVTVTTLHYAAG